MKESTFKRATEDLQEGDYVMIKLNKSFLVKQIENKRKMLEQAQQAAQQKSKQSKSAPAPMAPASGSSFGIPSNYKIDPPSFVVGQVAEVLPDLLFLTGACEERSKDLVRKGYEERELEKVTKITKEQYDMTIVTLLGQSK